MSLATVPTPITNDEGVVEGATTTDGSSTVPTTTPAAVQTPPPPPPITASWRYIGLHGHSVGTLTLDSKALQWKSASHGGNSDLDGTVIIKRVQAKRLKSAQWTVFGRSGYLRVQTKAGGSAAAEEEEDDDDDDEDEDGRKKKKRKKKSFSSEGPMELRFDGFPESDYAKLADAFEILYQVKISRKNVSASGASFGVADIYGKNLVFRESIVAEEEGEAETGEEIMSMDLTEVSQCVLPGNNRNEIELQFHESDTSGEHNTDQLVQIRFYVPPDPDVDPTDRDAPTAAEIFQQRIMSKANIKSTTGNVIAKFDETRGTFLTPRGRYTIELYDAFLRMRGNKYDYKIKYDDISRLFLLPRPDEFYMAFVIALDRPIRQGQQRYQYLVMQTNKDQSELEIHLDEEILEKEYNGDLQPVMQGSLSNLVAKTFKVITGKKVFVPGKFANASQHACVKCALRANEGHLYPLEKQFIFIHKPSVLVRFDEVESVEFQRYAGGQGSTRNFDLCVTLKPSAIAGPDAGGNKEYTFSGIDRSDYAALYSFLSGKKIRIKNIEDAGGVASAGPPPLAGEVVVPSRGAPGAAGGGASGDEMGSESSEDEDYEEGEASESEGISDDADEDGSGGGGGGNDSVDELSDDSDLAEYRQKAKKEAAKQAKEAAALKAAAEGKNPSREDDAKETKQKSSPKKNESSKKKSDNTGDDGKKKKAKKDPNAPKKPMTTFLLYSTTVRPQVKADNPDASFTDLAKLIGAQYKQLSEEEKKVYEEKALKDKERYEKEMAEYTKKNELAQAAKRKAEAQEDADDEGNGSGEKKNKKKKKKDKKEKGDSDEKKKKKKKDKSKDKDKKKKKKDKKKEKKPKEEEGDESD